MQSILENICTNNTKEHPVDVTACSFYCYSLWLMNEWKSDSWFHLQTFMLTIKSQKIMKNLYFVWLLSLSPDINQRKSDPFWSKSSFLRSVNHQMVCILVLQSTQTKMQTIWWFALLKNEDLDQNWSDFLWFISGESDSSQTKYRFFSIFWDFMVYILIQNTFISNEHYC